MSFDYQAYLASREWALKREAVRKRSGNRCERVIDGRRCPKSQQSVHHLTYARIGHELLEDLLAVCNDCHKWLSGKSNFDPLGGASRNLNIGITANIDEVRQERLRLVISYLASFPAEDLDRVRQLRDHKGWLVVYCSSLPNKEARCIIGDAWEGCGDSIKFGFWEPRSNITFVVNGTEYDSQGKKSDTCDW